MTQEEILSWAMNGVKAAWNKLNEQKKDCIFPTVKKAIDENQMLLMKKLLELGKMQDKAKEDESNEQHAAI